MADDKSWVISRETRPELYDVDFVFKVTDITKMDWHPSGKYKVLTGEIRRGELPAGGDYKSLPIAFKNISNEHYGSILRMETYCISGQHLPIGMSVGLLVDPETPAEIGDILISAKMWEYDEYMAYLDENREKLKEKGII